MSEREKYNEAFITVFGVEEKDLGSEFTSAKVGNWDSITQMSLVAELEDSFEILLDTDDIFELDSYEKGIAVLKKYGVEL